MRYRLYGDVSVVNEDDWGEMDNNLPYYDDYAVVDIPDIIVEHIEAEVLGK